MSKFVQKKSSNSKKDVKEHNDKVKGIMSNLNSPAKRNLSIRQKIDERRRQAKIPVEPEVRAPQSLKVVPETPLIPIFKTKIDEIKTLESNWKNILGEPNPITRLFKMFNNSPIATHLINKYDKTFFHAKSSEKVNCMLLRDFQNFIENKKIALVANSSMLLKNEYGTEIDSYDIVIRFNSFEINPVYTGEKTTIHVSIYLQDVNLNIFVPIRLIFSSTLTQWKSKIKKSSKLNQGVYLGYHHYKELLDISLLTQQPFTSGFHMLLLLILLGGYKEIKMFGFDFYKNKENSVYRHKDGLKYPISKVHNYDMEEHIINQTADVVDKKYCNYTFYDNSSL